MVRSVIRSMDVTASTKRGRLDDVEARTTDGDPDPFEVRHELFVLDPDEPVNRHRRIDDAWLAPQQRTQRVGAGHVTGCLGRGEQGMTVPRQCPVSSPNGR